MKRFITLDVVKKTDTHRMSIAILRKSKVGPISVVISRKPEYDYLALTDDGKAYWAPLSADAEIFVIKGHDILHEIGNLYKDDCYESMLTLLDAAANNNEQLLYREVV